MRGSMLRSSTTPIRTTAPTARDSWEARARRRRVAPSGRGVARPSSSSASRARPAAANGPATSGELLARLTSRERDVLRLMAEGRSNQAIARRLFISEKSVDRYTNNIFSKLELWADRDDNRRVLAVLHFVRATCDADCQVPA